MYNLKVVKNPLRMNKKQIKEEDFQGMLDFRVWEYDEKTHETCPIMDVFDEDGNVISCTLILEEIDELMERLKDLKKQMVDGYIYVPNEEDPEYAGKFYPKNAKLRVVPKPSLAINDEPWVKWSKEMRETELAAYKAGKRKEDKEYSYAKFFEGWGERDMQFVNGECVGSGMCLGGKQ
jgi:hypothetical protein